MTTADDFSSQFDEINEKGGQRTGNGGARVNRFKLIPFSELRPKTSANYRIKGLIPSTGIVVIWGPPKCYKSFWATDTALHIALGWEYRGRRVRQGSAVYCAFEGADGFYNRAEAFRRHHNLADDADVPFYLMPARINLIAEHKELIASIAAQTATPSAVYLDTLNRSLVGSESNDKDMAAYLDAADAIREAFGCVAIIIHHCGIDGSRPRGHTSLTGAVVAQLAVKRDGSNAVVTLEYMKDGPEDDQITSHMELVEVGVDEDGDVMRSMVVLPADNAAAAAKPKTKLSDANARFLNIVHEVVADLGEQLVPEAGMPRVRGMSRVICRDGLVRKGWFHEGLFSTDGKLLRTALSAENNALSLLQRHGFLGFNRKHVWLV